MREIVAVCLMLCLSTSAHAGFLGDLSSKLKQSANTIRLSIINGPQGQPSQAGQQLVVQSLDFVKLEKGVYGVPFKADLATVLKWCVDNNVNIQNPTKDQVEAQAKKDKEMAGGDPYIAQQAEQLFETLKNPSVDYGKVTYLLNKDFSNGVQCVVGGVQRLCNDRGITDSVYSLTVTPSEQSQNLLNQGLSTIKINFFKDQLGKLISYAAIATFSFEENDSDDFKKQYQILNGVLSQKYGEPFNPVHIRQSLNRYYPYLFNTEVISHNADKCLMWKGNVFMTFFGSYSGFSVFYFDPDVAGEASTAQVQIVQSIDQAMANVDANKVKVIQNNF